METRRKLTIGSEYILRALMQGMYDGLIITDSDGRILSNNQVAARLVGCSQDELIGQPLANFLLLDNSDKESSAAPLNREEHPSRDGENNEPPPIPGKIERLSAFKDELPVHASVISRTGMSVTMPVSHLPIFDDKDQVIGHLTIIYIVHASSVQQAQTEFVSTVSHELRTPLTSIKGFADTILRTGDRLDLAQQRRFVGIIKDQADRLTRLVEDLLSVSRLESKKMQLTIRAIDLGETVQRVLRNLADKAGDHRIITNIPPGLAPIWADGDRLEQILTNLIDNAIKYSPPRTTVTVAAREINAHPALVEFSVSDQGVGISREHLPEIFSKFTRLDNPLVRQTEGTGLGLYITRSLVIALGGEISVASVPGNTTFTVRLPAATLEDQAARGRD